jgi:hypothetical protein
MNPQDLLFTNQFVSSKSHLQDLQRASSHRKGRAYKELKQHLQHELQDSDPFIREQKSFLDDEENDFDLLEPAINQPALANVLNRPEWLSNEEPLALSQGVRPLLGRNVEGLGRFRYRKLIVSYINIDSRDRDKRKFPSPSKYTIYLNKQFNYVQTIRMASIEYREPPTPINGSNNCACWQSIYTGLNAGAPNEIIYDATIPSAYFTLSDFVQATEAVLNSVPHQRTIRFFDPTGGPGGEVDVTNPFPRFRLTIDPFTRLLRLLQRLDEFMVSEIRTTINSNVVEFDLVFDTIAAGTVCGDTNLPFVTTESLPIILAGLELFVTEVGGIPVHLIESVPFFPTGPGNSYTCVLVTPGTPGTITYSLSVFQTDGITPALASQTTTINLTSGSTLPVPQAGHPLVVSAGRALQFTFPNECNFSTFLGIQNNQVSDTTVFETCDFPKTESLQGGALPAYVFTNVNPATGNIQNTIPWKIVGSGMLVLDTDDYIFMRLKTPFMPLDTISGNLICARGASFQDGDCSKEKPDEFDFFSKIVFATFEPGDVTVRFVGADRIFYDAPLVKLTSLTVEFYDANGKLVDTAIDHSFTLQIIEQREILKETLIDSRTGAISDTGSGLVTTNPV